MRQVAYLDGSIQVCQLAEVSVCHLPGLGILGGLQELETLQLSKDLTLHLRILGDQIPAGSFSPYHDL